MMKRFHRRRLVAFALAGLLGLTRPRTGRAETMTMDVCFWRAVGDPYCDVNGRKIQRQCYVCCSGRDCETLWCAWRDLGPC